MRWGYDHELREGKDLKGGGVAYIKSLPQNSEGKTEKNSEKLGKYSRCPDQDLNREHSK
jgi:hypothetical protein